MSLLHHFNNFHPTTGYNTSCFMRTPKTMNPYLPPEWAPQSGVMLTWPPAHSDWSVNLAAVEHCYGQITAAICRFEKALIVCQDPNHQVHVKALLAQYDIPMDRLVFALSTANDTWARDHGPITIIEADQPRLLDFTFNAWGNKFDSSKDNAINRNISEYFIAPMSQVDLVLEGGSIEVDGHGSLLTTRQCLMSPQRNPELSEAEIETALKRLFGVTQILWLEHGYLAGDDTDSHIDTLARFCDAHTIVYMHCNDANDEHYVALQAMEEELKQLRDSQGQPYKLVPMPWPGDIRDQYNQRLPASYVNFLIINGAVLVPIYGISSDQDAITTLQHCFPQREVIAINCLPLIQQFGSLHCITMQLPQGVLA